MLIAVMVVLGVCMLTVLPAYYQASKGALVLTYHQVDPVLKNGGEQAFSVTPETFRTQMTWFKKSGYKVVPLKDVLAGVYGSTSLQRKSVAITFDDGYMNTATHAIPCLNEFGFPATIFVVADCVGGVNVWDMQEGLDQAALMGWDTLRKSGQQQVTVESHGMTHQRLSRLDDRTLREEVKRSREILEDKLGKPVELICYPYGAYSPEVVHEVKSAGYRGACCNIFGRNLSEGDPYQLRRIRVESSDTPWRLWMKLQMSIWYETFRILRSKFFERQ